MAFYPGVSDRVLWFPDANPDEIPSAAIVTGPYPPNSKGLLNLMIFSDGTAQTVAIVRVRHIDDPYLADHPELRRSRGAWDYPKRRQQAKDISKDVG